MTSHRKSAFSIQRLTPAHAAEYRAFMLQAYDSEPAAFTATVAEREHLPTSFWESRLSDQPDPDQLVFGAFADSRLVGVTGLRYQRRPRTRHKAALFGMFVRPDFRNRGTGRALVDAVLHEAGSTPGIEIVQLTVTQTNEAAIKLYESCGFSTFGIEPYANLVDGGFVAVVHMWRPVGFTWA